MAIDTVQSSGRDVTSPPSPLESPSASHTQPSTRKRNAKQPSSRGLDTDTDTEPQAKKQKIAGQSGKAVEKRLKRFRSRAPLAYNEIRDRALTQRMFVIDRRRHSPRNDADSLVAHPSETFSLAGTTGNIYHVTIDKLPSCDCPHARKGNQCKHLVYVLARVLRAPEDLQYQLAFLSTELNQIFEHAPLLPSQTADESARDGNRKPIDGECPICCNDFESDDEQETIVYCKAACGNNIHKECFELWAKTKRAGTVACPFCRTPWSGSDEGTLKDVAQNGALNEEGYVNVADQLGLSGERDYSTYNEFWLRRRRYLG